MAPRLVKLKRKKRKGLKWKSGFERVKCLNQNSEESYIMDYKIPQASKLDAQFQFFQKRWQLSGKLCRNHFIWFICLQTIKMVLKLCSILLVGTILFQALHPSNSRVILGEQSSAASTPKRNCGLRWVRHRNSCLKGRTLENTRQSQVKNPEKVSTMWRKCIIHLLCNIDKKNIG